MKNRNLANLYSKKIKLGSRLSEVDRALKEKSEQKYEAEKQLHVIDSAILQEELPNYLIKLSDLKQVLSKISESDSGVDGILQSCIKHAFSVQEYTRDKSNEQVIEATTCTCEGRMNVCLDTDPCPIVTKAKCDGRKIALVLVKKEL